MNKTLQNLVILIFSLVITQQNASSKDPSVLALNNDEKITYELKVGDTRAFNVGKNISVISNPGNYNNKKVIKFNLLKAKPSGYQKFMVTALEPGQSKINLKIGDHAVSYKFIVTEDYSDLELKLNELFGLNNEVAQDKIKVIASSALTNNSESNTHSIFLKGKVASSQQALLALTFAAKALNDNGIKVYSSPGGNLKSASTALNATNAASNNSVPTSNNNNFLDLSQTDMIYNTRNINRNIILSSKNERVISFITVKEPKRYAIKVRFLQLDSRYVDQYLNSLVLTVAGQDIRGGLGSPALNYPTVSPASNFITAQGGAVFDASGLINLASQIAGGNFVSGAIKLFDSTVLNMAINNLIEEGAVRLINEFSLVTQAGEKVELGKGTRFPIPQINNFLGGSNIGVEYIPIGFQGELVVNSLEDNLIDVQLVSRLTTAQQSDSSLQGFNIPVFTEQYVNSGSVLKSNQEVVLNSFLTENEALVRARSPLGRLIPFLGTAKRKQNVKNILFVALQAKEMLPINQIDIEHKLILPELDPDNIKALPEQFDPDRVIKENNRSLVESLTKNFNQEG